MAVVPASRLDVEWDRAGDWEIIVGRRTTRGVVLPAVAGDMEVRAIDAPSSTPALVSVVGSVSVEGRVTLRVTREDMEALPENQYEHLIRLVDRVSNLRMPLLRGYISLVDNAGGG